jgi:hypothetical protein
MLFLRTVLACAGWFFAGIFGGTVFSIVLCYFVLMLSNCYPTVKL